MLPHTLDIKKWLVICEWWCFAPTSPERFGSVRPDFYSGSLLDTTIFRSCAALLRPNYLRSSTPIQWPTGGIDALRGRYGPYRGQNSGRPIQVEGSSPGVKFQPGDDCSDPIHRSGNDNSGAPIQSVAGHYSTTTGCDQNTTSSFIRSSRTDMPGPGFYTETPAGGSLVGIFGYISCTRSPSHRSHGCGRTRHQYGRPATHPLCTTPHVTPEDEKRRGMRCRDADRRPN